MFTAPGAIRLYDDAPGAGIDFEQIAAYLRGHLPAVGRVSIEGSYFLRPGTELEKVADAFARARVRNAFRRAPPEEPLPGEVKYETRRLQGRAGAVFGIPYDGLKILRLASSLPPPHPDPPPQGGREDPSVAGDTPLCQPVRGKSPVQADPSLRPAPFPATLNLRVETGPLSVAHIIFTNQLLGTWDAEDRRFHLRAAIFGFPSMISTSGIVEAPAKPRGYYYLRDRLAEVGKAELARLAAEEEFAGRFLTHGDERLTEVAKGYVMQAVLFHATGEPFCNDPNCRLFNAHWQEELLRSQLSPPEFCERHARLLKELAR